jgi:hypothetical protein
MKRKKGKKESKKETSPILSILLLAIGSLSGVVFLHLIGVIEKDPTGGLLSEQPGVTFAAILLGLLGFLVWLILPGIYKK